MSFNVTVEEELVQITIQDALISNTVSDESYNVTISEEALYFDSSEEVYNVSVSEEVFKETFTESERITVNNRFDLDVLNKAEQKEIVYDSPSVGDITIYYGIAEPLSLTSDPVWLITRTIYVAPDLDSTKKFASASFNKVWDDYLTHTYQ